MKIIPVAAMKMAAARIRTVHLTALLAVVSCRTIPQVQSVRNAIDGMNGRCAMAVMITIIR